MEPLPRPFRFDVLTLFPGLFDGFLNESILKRAIARGLVEVHRWDLRDWGIGRHKQLDDRPFGGGPGMVLMAPPIVEAAEAVQGQGESPGHLVLLSPRGRRLDQARIQTLAELPQRRIVLLCGRYEGFDERIIEELRPEELSIGDYVLSGGEVPAMAVIDAVMRLLPDVLGDELSSVDESFGPDGGLEYPQYTRPREFRGRTVPEILLSGDHAAIDQWRKRQRRPSPLHPTQELTDPKGP